VINLDAKHEEATTPPAAAPGATTTPPAEAPANDGKPTDELNAGEESDLAAYGLDGIPEDEEPGKPDEDGGEQGAGDTTDTPAASDAATAGETNTGTEPGAKPTTETPPAEETTKEGDAAPATTALADDEANKPVSQKEFRARINAFAKQRFEEEAGEKYDPFNEDHQLSLATIAAEVAAEVKENIRESNRRIEVAQESGKKINNILPTSEMQKFADELFDGQTRREAKRIESALERGDYGPMLEFCEKAAKEFNARKTGGKKVEEIKKRNSAPPPPVLEGAGGRGNPGGGTDDGMDQLEGFGLT